MLGCQLHSADCVCPGGQLAIQYPAITWAHCAGAAAAIAAGPLPLPHLQQLLPPLLLPLLPPSLPPPLLPPLLLPLLLPLLPPPPLLLLLLL